MVNRKIKAVVIDIDGTITKEISWLYFAKALGADPKEAEKIYIDYKRDLIDYPESKRQLISLWQKTGNATKRNMIRIFKNIPIKNGAVNLVAYLKKKYRVCLISGAIDIFVKVTSERLGVDDWYANTKTYYDSGDLLIDYDYYIDQAKKKYEHFEIYSKKLQLSVKDCAVIGDGDNDRILLEKLSFPIIIPNENTPKDLLRSVKVICKTLADIRNYL